MECPLVRERLGAYVDGELSRADAEALAIHVRACPGCAQELQRVDALVERLDRAAGPSHVRAPGDAWLGIEPRLAGQHRSPRRGRHRHHRSRSRRNHTIARLLRRPIAAALSLALLIGVIAVSIGSWIRNSVPPAEEASVDYSLLLDGIAADVDAAVNRFLQRYGADSIAPELLSAVAPRLNYRLPPELPGGFRREAVYRVQFGSAEGVAARYRRAGEPLIVIFHPPIERMQLGPFQESRCRIADSEGRRIRVGPWQLTRSTDLTTCHSLLSRESDEAVQTAILEAVDPGMRRPVQTRPAMIWLRASS